AAVAALLSACGSGDPARTGYAGAGYVGSAACASCHADVARSWESSRHRLAVTGAGGSVPAPGSSDGPLGGRDDMLALTAASLGYGTDVMVPYVLGLKHVEQPLGMFPAGRVQALPRAFDVPRREWFDLFAGDPRTFSDWGHWTNRGMNANAQ